MYENKNPGNLVAVFFHSYQNALVYSWYPYGVLNTLSVLMVSFKCTENPQCAHDNPHMHLGIPPVYS